MGTSAGQRQDPDAWPRLARGQRGFTFFRQQLRRGNSSGEVSPSSGNGPGAGGGGGREPWSEGAGTVPPVGGPEPRESGGVACTTPPLGHRMRDTPCVWSCGRWAEAPGQTWTRHTQMGKVRNTEWGPCECPVSTWGVEPRTPRQGLAPLSPPPSAGPPPDHSPGTGISALRPGPPLVTSRPGKAKPACHSHPGGMKPAGGASDPSNILHPVFLLCFSLNRRLWACAHFRLAPGSTLFILRTKLPSDVPLLTTGKGQAWHWASLLLLLLLGAWDSLCRCWTPAAPGGWEGGRAGGRRQPGPHSCRGLEPPRGPALRLRSELLRWPEGWPRTNVIVPFWSKHSVVPGHCLMRHCSCDHPLGVSWHRWRIGLASR